MDRKLITIALILLTFSLSAQLKSGLVGYWKFENNALDATMHDNDGTVYGATYTSSGKIGGCYDFDGSNDYISIPYSTSLDFTNEFSISTWISTDIDNWTENFGIIFSNGKTLSSSFDYPNSAIELWARDDGTLNFRIYSDTEQDNYIYSLAQLSTSVWTHILITFDDGVVDLYIDGSLVNWGTASDPITVSTLRILNRDYEIGRDGVRNDFWYKGKIDEPMVCNRTLTATEVKSIYNSGNGVYFVMENFRKDKDYEKLNKYFISRMYFDWIESAA